MYKIYSNLLKHVLDDSITPGLIDNYYSQIVEALNASADLAVTVCRRNFYKFWWDHSWDEIKEKSVVF